MFNSKMLDQAEGLLKLCTRNQILIVSTETVTSGLLAACLTSVPGASKVFERGFILYHDSAKATGLGVPADLCQAHGA